MKLSRTRPTPHLSGSMSLAGNYQPHSEASYSQRCCFGSRYEPSSATPPSPVDCSTPYLGWTLSNYCLEASQDFTSAQVKDYNNPTINNNNGIKSGKVVKKRVTANRKERRRTLSINTAFQELRECIPNVPSDTKLSKIKTLKLATSYIQYLIDLLAEDDRASSLLHGRFKDGLRTKFESKEERRKREIDDLTAGSNGDRRPKGRTGWPQHVWALELKNDS